MTLDNGLSSIFVDMNQVRSEFGLKMFANQSCKIGHISQTVHHNELTNYREILDTCNYILVIV